MCGTFSGEQKPVIYQKWEDSVHPIVSISCIAYNHENFIRDAIEGFLMQITNFPIEIIFHDDASTDRTVEIVREYEAKYPQLIKPIYQIENQYSIGNNPGLLTFRKVSGKYIALCEGDDYWTDPYKLQKQVDFLEANEDYIITYHNFKAVDSNGNLVEGSQYPDECKKDFSSDELKRGAYILTLSLCFRNVIKEFPAEMLKVKNGDTFLIGLLGQYGKGKYLENIEPAIYRIHTSGIWSSANNHLKRKYHRNTFKYMANYFSRIGDRETGLYYLNLIKNQTDQYLSESLNQSGILDIFLSYRLYFWDFKVYKNFDQFVYLNKKVVKRVFRNIILLGKLKKPKE